MSLASGSMPEIEVAWGKERMMFTLPAPPATLRDLKSLIADRTGIAPDQMKLISHGFQMKDDNVSLEKYQLYDQDQGWTSEIKPAKLFRPMAPKKRGPQRIVLIASPETQAIVSDRGDSDTQSTKRGPLDTVNRSLPADGAAGEPIDEPGTLKRIEDILEKASKANLPTIEALERRSPLSAPNAAASANESLFQTLLTLDGMTMKPQWGEARTARKNGIKVVQGWLDRLDTAREHV